MFDKIDVVPTRQIALDTRYNYKLLVSWKTTMIRLSAICFMVMASLAGGLSIAQTNSPDGSYKYTLLPGDMLEISVWKEPELQKSVLIRPDGRFSFPLIGDVLALGKTVTEIQNELTETLKQFIPEAVLTVTVTDVAGNKIYVLGQVKEPGVFVVNPRVDVLQALSIAGGLTPFAAANDIILIRRSGDKQQTFGFRYSDIEKGRNLEQNVLLSPGDILIVP